MHLSLNQVFRENLHIATTAVDLLLVFDRKLNDQRLALIAERLKTRRGGVETSILTRLQAWKTIQKQSLVIQIDLCVNCTPVKTKLTTGLIFSINIHIKNLF